MVTGTWTIVLALLLGAPPASAQDDDPALKQFYVANSAYNRKLYPVAISQFEDFLRKNGNS